MARIVLWSDIISDTIVTQQQFLGHYDIVLDTLKIADNWMSPEFNDQLCPEIPVPHQFPDTSWPHLRVNCEKAESSVNHWKALFQWSK